MNRPSVEETSQFHFNRVYQQDVKELLDIAKWLIGTGHDIDSSPNSRMKGLYLSDLALRLEKSLDPIKHIWEE